MSEKDLNVDLGLPRQRFTQPRRVQTSMLVDDSAADLGKAVSDTMSAFNTRMQNIETSKNALDTFIIGLEEKARSLDNLDDNNVKQQLQEKLFEEINKIHTLGYNSIGRDQSEYRRQSAQLVSSTKNVLENLLNKDEQAARYSEIIKSGNAANKISGSTPSVNQHYLQDILLNNGRGSNVNYENGAWIVSYTDKDKNTLKFNANNDINATKKGAKGLFQEVEDFNPSYKTSYDRILAKYTPLLKQVTEQDKATGKTIVTKSKEYNAIRNDIINELKADPNFAANVSQDEVQFLKGVGALAGDFEQADINKLNNDISTKRADYIAGLYLPKDQTLSETISPTPKPKSVKVDGKDKDKKLKINNDKFIASLVKLNNDPTTIDYMEPDVIKANEAKNLESIRKYVLGKNTNLKKGTDRDVRDKLEEFPPPNGFDPNDENFIYIRDNDPVKGGDYTYIPLSFTNDFEDRLYNMEDLDIQLKDYLTKETYTSRKPTL